MADPSGRIIALPIRSNFREGLTALEYFISTHGARKGLADTALRTADAGYLTRRLVDVAQDVIINEPTAARSPASGSIARRRMKIERALRRAARRPGSGSRRRSPQDRRRSSSERARRSSRTQSGYRRRDEDRRSHGALAADLPIALRHVPEVLRARPGARRLVQIGEAVGIIAAQTIGEPGTQLTLRTFHTGGVAGDRRHHPGPAARAGAVRGPHSQGRGHHGRDRQAWSTSSGKATCARSRSTTPRWSRTSTDPRRSYPAASTMGPTSQEDTRHRLAWATQTSSARCSGKVVLR